MAFWAHGLMDFMLGSSCQSQIDGLGMKSIQDETLSKMHLMFIFHMFILPWSLRPSTLCKAMFFLGGGGANYSQMSTLKKMQLQVERKRGAKWWKFIEKHLLMDGPKGSPSTTPIHLSKLLTFKKCYQVVIKLAIDFIEKSHLHRSPFARAFLF
jgi:hypothetical protein